MPTRTKLLFFSAALVLSMTPLQANPYDYRQGPAAQVPASVAPPGPYTSQPLPDYQKITPVDVLKDGIDRLQDFISSGEIYNQDRFERFVNEEVKPFFDFEEMARLVAGRFYYDLKPEDQRLFRNRLEEMFLMAFMRQVSEHAGPQPQVDFLPARFRGPDEVETLARVLFPDGYSTRLVFRFHRGKDGWKIYDVAADGSSAVLYYRHHFLSRARQLGPEALLK
jgi:phospholipid transport system substrate-binding protein